MPRRLLRGPHHVQLSNSHFKVYSDYDLYIIEILTDIHTGIHHNTSGRSLTSSGSGSISPCSIVPNQHPFQSAMSAFTDVSPVQLTFHLFTNHVINEEEFEKAEKLDSNPGNHSVEFNMKILMKVYHILKENPKKINGVCSALEKFNKQRAQKLAEDSDSCRLQYRIYTIGTTTYRQQCP